MNNKKSIENGSIHYGGYVGDDKFWLSHSCDEWVIGDLEKAKKFLTDLDKTIKEVEAL